MQRLSPHQPPVGGPHLLDAGAFAEAEHAKGLRLAHFRPGRRWRCRILRMAVPLHPGEKQRRGCPRRPRPRNARPGTAARLHRAARARRRTRARWSLRRPSRPSHDRESSSTRRSPPRIARSTPAPARHAARGRARTRQGRARAERAGAPQARPRRRRQAAPTAARAEAAARASRRRRRRGGRGRPRAARSSEVGEEPPRRTGACRLERRASAGGVGPDRAEQRPELAGGARIERQVRPAG